MKYKIIYADPAWMYYTHYDSKNPTRENNSIEGTPTEHYETMSIEQLEKFPINDFADEKNCVLFLWVTSPKLHEGIRLIQSWGFVYKTIGFVWIKLNKSGSGYYSGLGFHTNQNIELVLIGKRGRVERKCKDIKQLVFAPLQRHSKKPNEVRDRIVKLYGELPRIELFARERFQGWDVYGDQVGSGVQEVLIPTVQNKSEEQ